MARSPLCSFIGSRVYVDTMSSIEENVCKIETTKISLQCIIE